MTHHIVCLAPKIRPTLSLDDKRRQMMCSAESQVMLCKFLNKYLNEPDKKVEKNVQLYYVVSNK